jgi:hemerythrin-like domain-containing protein
MKAIEILVEEHDSILKMIELTQTIWNMWRKLSTLLKTSPTNTTI